MGTYIVQFPYPTLKLCVCHLHIKVGYTYIPLLSNLQYYDHSIAVFFISLCRVRIGRINFLQ